MPPAYGGKISREATPTAGKITGEATRTVIEALMVHLLWLFLRESFPSVTIIKGTTLPSVTIILRQCDVEGELALSTVTPTIFTPPFLHWHKILRLPVATTENTTAVPSATVVDTGCVVITGESNGAPAYIYLKALTTATTSHH